MNSFYKPVLTNELFECNIPFLKDFFAASDYPWQILPQIKEILEKLIAQGIDGYTYYSDTVLIGGNVKIAPTATIEGNVVLGAGCIVRPGAYIRGNVIAGESCVIGNSSELKNCILLDHVQVPHYNYIGDSILGNYAHMGAGSICSNLRADGANVVVHADRDFATGLRKVGAFIADRGDIGCGSVLNPGTVIGKGTSIYPLTSVRGVMPEYAIVKTITDIVKRNPVQDLE